MAEWEGMSYDCIWSYCAVRQAMSGRSTLFEWFNGRTERYLHSWSAQPRGCAAGLARGVPRHQLTDEPARFRTWLFQTTRHRAIDYLRKQKRERELVSQASNEATEVSEPAEESSTLDLSNFDAVLAELPTPQQEALLLRYRDDLNYNEIALIVGCSVGTIRSRLHHAKRRMQELMATHTRGQI
jgi:RNA polymerase sigma factor (sigma-70 family)